MLPESVQPSELTFIGVAAYALYLWAGNWRAARVDLRAAHMILDEDGVLGSARATARRAGTLALGPVFIIAVGLILTTFTPNPDGSLFSRWMIAIFAIGLSMIFIIVARDQRRTRETSRAHYRAEHPPEEKDVRD